MMCGKDKWPDWRDGRRLAIRKDRPEMQQADYMTLSTCSLICSSSSFMRTTMFCISATLLLEPVVLI